MLRPLIFLLAFAAYAGVGYVYTVQLRCKKDVKGAADQELTYQRDGDKE